MIKDGLNIKAFYKGKEVRVIPLKNLNHFFNGLSVLSDKWKVKPFTHLWGQEIGNETNHAALTIMIGLLYKDMCTKTGWQVNAKRFKSEMLLDVKKPKVFLLESDYLTIPKNVYDDALRKLKKIDLVHSGWHGSYIRFNDVYVDYCRKLGNYLFNNCYARHSIKENMHYFGDHSSMTHYEAFQERKQINNKTLN